MLGINAERRFFLGEVDQAGVKADIISDFCKTSQDDIIRSDSHPDLGGRGLIKARRPLFIESPLYKGSFDENDSLLHGDSGGKDFVNSFPEIIEILLAVNHKGKDGHFIDLAGVSGLGNRRGRKSKNKDEK
jgi:hypothetical protein